MVMTLRMGVVITYLETIVEQISLICIVAITLLEMNVSKTHSATTANPTHSATTATTTYSD
jgi:hypothetical protein